MIFSMSEELFCTYPIDLLSFVDVNEAKAAAATYGFSVYAGMQSSTKFNADRPFIFIIWDDETESVLFMGKMADPTNLSKCGPIQLEQGFCR